MAQVGSMYASMTLNNANFISGMKRSEAQTRTTSQAIATSMGKAATAVKGLLAVMAVDALAGFTKRMLDYADAFDDFSTKTGIATGLLQSFSYAAQLNGSNQESAFKGLDYFNKLVGDAQNGVSSAEKVLAKYGVTATNLTDAVSQAADAIRGLNTNSAQAAATAELFGKKASNLKDTLKGGSEGLAAITAEAKKYGIVIDEYYLRAAGHANDEMAKTKMLLTAQFANIIVQNADAITGMATATLELVNALRQIPLPILLALGGALGGAMAGGVVGGLPGAGIGAVVGGLAGGGLGVAGIYNSPENQRKRAEATVAAAQKRLDDMVSSGYVRRARGGGGQKATADDIAVARDQLTKAKADLAQKIAYQNLQLSFTDPSGDRTDLSGGGASAAKKAANLAAKAAQDRKEGRLRMADETMRAQEDYWNAFRPKNADDDANKQLHLATIDFTSVRDRLDADFEKEYQGYIDTYGDSSKQAKEYLDELTVHHKSMLAANESLYKQQLDEIDANSKYQKELDANRLLDARASAFRDELQSQEYLARTQKERRKVLNQLLDIEVEQRRRAYQEVLDNPDAPDNDKVIAQLGLDRLQSWRKQEGGIINTQTMDPLSEFIDAMPRSIDEINEGLQGIAAEGLQSLNDGLVDAIMHGSSLGDMFSNLADQIIADLLRMAVVQPLTGLLGSAIGSLFPGAALLGHANGGLLSTGDWSIMNERGGELVKLPGGSTVIPNDKLDAVLSGGNRGGITIAVDARGSTDEAFVRKAVAEGIQISMPYINQSGYAYTMKQAARPRM